MMHRVDPQVYNELDRLRLDPSAPAHVRGSCARWLVQVLDSLGHGQQAGLLVEELQGCVRAGQRESRFADRNLILIELDRALASGQPDRAWQAIERLQAREPGLMANLLSRASQGANQGLWVARHYPY